MPTLAPAPASLLAAMEATWPAARAFRHGPWVLREGLGGGKRVSAATVAPDACTIDAPEIASAEAAMRAMGQTPLFMLRPDDAQLDSALHARGYSVVDPVVVYAAALQKLDPAPPPPLTAFPIWPPLSVMRDVWADAGIGAARLAVMDRVRGPRTAILGRLADHVSGTVFVACDGPVAMVHALEVAPALRGRGAGRAMMQGAVHWARAQGAEWLALAVTTANAPARRLYDRFGMTVVTAYHYRQHPQG